MSLLGVSHYVFGACSRSLAHWLADQCPEEAAQAQPTLTKAEACLRRLGALLSGESSRHIQETPNLMTTSKLLKFVLSFAQGVKHLHSQKIMHRDLKPQNLLIGAAQVRDMCTHIQAMFPPSPRN